MNDIRIFNNSAIVVAHPDDECLWFSSILSRVDQVAISFLEVSSNQQWTIGRKRSLSEYPMENIISLNIEESMAYRKADWKNSQLTEYGLKIVEDKLARKKYQENYYLLKQKLESILAGYKNVFTHSPWGEYGNEEHIQTFKVLHDLQNKLNFTLWFPNYCSNQSFTLMLKYISSFESKQYTFITNQKLALKIKELYSNNGCWTWYDDWKWFKYETFMQYSEASMNGNSYIHISPLNIFNIRIPVKRNFFQRFSYRLRKKLVNLLL